jgi:hypothetical protein
MGKNIKAALLGAGIFFLLAMVTALGDWMIGGFASKWGNLVSGVLILGEFIVTVLPTYYTVARSEGQRPSATGLLIPMGILSLSLALSTIAVIVGALLPESPSGFPVVVVIVVALLSAGLILSLLTWHVGSEFKQEAARVEPLKRAYLNILPLVEELLFTADSGTPADKASWEGAKKAIRSIQGQIQATSGHLNPSLNSDSIEQELRAILADMRGVLSGERPAEEARAITLQIQGLAQRMQPRM